jgi:hypothetical protein
MAHCLMQRAGVRSTSNSLDGVFLLGACEPIFVTPVNEHTNGLAVVSGGYSKISVVPNCQWATSMRLTYA